MLLPLGTWASKSRATLYQWNMQLDSLAHLAPLALQPPHRLLLACALPKGGVGIEPGLSRFNPPPCAPQLLLLLVRATYLSRFQRLSPSHRLSTLPYPPPPRRVSIFCYETRFQQHGTVLQTRPEQARHLEAFRYQGKQSPHRPPHPWPFLWLHR